MCESSACDSCVVEDCEDQQKKWRAQQRRKQYNGKTCSGCLRYESNHATCNRVEYNVL